MTTGTKGVVAVLWATATAGCAVGSSAPARPAAQPAAVARVHGPAAAVAAPPAPSPKTAGATPAADERPADSVRGLAAVRPAAWWAAGGAVSFVALVSLGYVDARGRGRGLPHPADRQRP